MCDLQTFIMTITEERTPEIQNQQALQNDHATLVCNVLYHDIPRCVTIPNNKAKQTNLD